MPSPFSRSISLSLMEIVLSLMVGGYGTGS